MEKTITNHPDGYPELRNIIKDEPHKFIYKKDWFDFGLKVAHRLTGKGYHPFWKGFYYNPKDNKTPCHFFNTINLGKNPFKVHFETTLPRLGKAPKWLYKLGIKKLAADNCKEIIAISQCAYDMQIAYLQQNYPKYLNSIQAKMKVVLPPQKPLIKEYADKKLPKNKIVFTLVGGDFFRKGGGEVLQAFDQLIPKHPELVLNIVSSLNYGDYATHTTKENQESALEIIKKYPNNINHYHFLPNKEVLELLINSHIGLLPTWADSFGYSVLESQAAGCPCITTDIRALPEVNNDEMGWMIKLQSPIYNSENREFMIRELMRIIESIVKVDDSIKIKGKKALEYIKGNHSQSVIIE